MSKSSSRADFIIKVFIVFVLILILANYITNVATGQILTFEGLLSRVSDFTSVPFNQLYDFTITSDWGLVNFFRDFLNIFAKLLSLALFFATNVINAVWFVIQCAGLMLGF